MPVYKHSPGTINKVSVTANKMCRFMKTNICQPWSALNKL